MKLHLISVLLLLVPLVSAKSLGTILYSNNGTNDFVIINGDSLYNFGYVYSGNALHIVMLSSQMSFGGPLILKSDLLKKEKITLVVDWQLNGDGHSSESLKHLIKRIGNQVILREPEEEEQKKLEEYKQGQTLKSNFKIVYDQTKISAEACGLMHLDVNYQKSNSTQSDFAAQAGVIDGRSSFIRFIADNQTIGNASFVIERLPGRKDRDCQKDEVAGLKPSFCSGEMVLRSLD